MRIRGLIGQDQHFAGARRGVDVHLPEHGHLGRGDVLVPRPHDLVHFGYAGCAVRHAPHGPWPADLNDSIRAREVRGHERGRIRDHTLVGRRACDRRLHPCGSGREDGHQNARRIDRATPRHVAAHDVHRAGDPACEDPRCDFDGPHLAFELCAVEPFDVRGRESELLHDIRVDRLIRSLDLLPANDEIIGREIGFELRVVLQCDRVPSFANVQHDPPHLRVDLGYILHGSP